MAALVLTTALTGPSATALTLGGTTSAPPPSASIHSARPARPAPRLDTTSKAAVTRLWRQGWLPATRVRVSPTGGSTALCLPFTTPASAQAAILQAINVARALTGVAPIESVADPSGAAAKSALIQAANRQLSHSPTARALCYSAAGARAARRSDVGLWGSTSKNWRPTASAIVRAYLSDPGKGNADAAHRIWLLRGAARHLAAGFALMRSGGWTWVGNSIVVFPTSSDASPAAGLHGWPSPGWFPIQLEPAGRWSLSSGSGAVRFTRARVSVTRNGKAVKVSRVTASTKYGDHALVWQLAKRPSLGKASSVRYCVKVTRITGAKDYTGCTRFYRP